MPSVTAHDGDQEGMPTVLFEAMASGLPVIATRTGGISSFIKNYKNGMLCDEKEIGQLVDLITILMDDSTLYSMIRNEGLKNVMFASYNQRAQDFFLLFSKTKQSTKSPFIILNRS